VLLVIGLSAKLDTLLFMIEAVLFLQLQP